MIVVNNGIFGMTGGQMNLATTLIGDKTVSSKAGRRRETMGHPVDMLQAIKTFDVEFAARGALYDTRHIATRPKRFIKKGFENQRDNKGFSIIEVLSPAPPTGSSIPSTPWKRSKTRTKRCPRGRIHRQRR